MKVFFEVIFFFTGSVIAILTYRQAMKTLFTPIKTETFRVQLTLFEKIYLYFQSKSNFELMSDFDLAHMRDLNAHELLLDFAEFHFKENKNLQERIKIKRKKLHENISGLIASKEYVEKHFSLATINRTDASQSTESSGIESWDKYNFGRVLITKKYNDSIKLVEQFIKSPFLTESVRNALINFKTEITNNMKGIQTEMNQVAQALPNYIKSEDDLPNINMSLASNIIRDKEDPKFEELANKIMTEIQIYLDIENLIER